jgi:hypothetical protein
MSGALLGLGVMLWTAGAAAGSKDDDIQRAQLEKVRAQVAGEVQFAAYDLIDELVLAWKSDPLFAESTPVVLADVTVPVGLGTGLQAMLENHISSVLVANPDTKVRLVHCPSCMSTVVHSGPEGTVLSRGIDQPDVLAKLGEKGDKHALFIDFEAQGQFLVLRARLTKLTPELPVVWSRTLSSSTSTAAMLRAADDLKTVEEAREEYLKALRGGGIASIPLRFTIRSYAPSYNDLVASAPPFLWIQSGVELAPTDARAWMSSFILGYAAVPQSYQGLMGQARFYRLLTGRARSVTRPDVYGFLGGSVMTVWGPAAASFRQRTLTADELVGDNAGDSPRNTFSTLHLGADMRLGNRVGLSAFFETIPSLRNSENFGEYFYFLGLPWQSFGTEVAFCF